MKLILEFLYATKLLIPVSTFYISSFAAADDARRLQSIALKEYAFSVQKLEIIDSEVPPEITLRKSIIGGLISDLPNGKIDTIIYKDSKVSGAGAWDPRGIGNTYRTSKSPLEDIVKLLAKDATLGDVRDQIGVLPVSDYGLMHYCVWRIWIPEYGETPFPMVIRAYFSDEADGNSQLSKKLAAYSISVGKEVVPDRKQK